MFFLDYYATGSVVPEVVQAVMEGLTRACKQSGIALIGGETAEMPDIYIRQDYDLAGTVVGMVDKNKIIDGSNIRAGDLLIGLRSTGLHTNGYSLARRVLMGPLSGFRPSDRPDELGGETVAGALLRVHRNYLQIIRDLKPVAHAFVHVTGGGIEANTERDPSGRSPCHHQVCRLAKTSAVQPYPTTWQCPGTGYATHVQSWDWPGGYCGPI